MLQLDVLYHDPKAHFLSERRMNDHLPTLTSAEGCAPAAAESLSGSSSEALHANDKPPAGSGHEPRPSAKAQASSSPLPRKRFDLDRIRS